MSNRDFFDDDLHRAEEAELRGKLAANDVTRVNDEGAVGEGVVVKSVSDFTLTRMTKHKQELDLRVAGATEELEKLRQRQGDLDRQRKDLEDLRKKQDDYAHGKREMIDRLTQSLVTIEKEEIAANRLAELLSATRKRFKAMLGDLQAIDEEVWPEDGFRTELNKASTLVDDVRLEYNKSVAKIDAVTTAAPAAGGAPGAHPAVIFEEGRRHEEEPEKNFAYWLKVGAAVTLPLLIVLLALMGVIIWRTH